MSDNMDISDWVKRCETLEFMNNYEVLGKPLPWKRDKKGRYCRKFQIADGQNPCIGICMWVVEQKENGKAWMECAFDNDDYMEALVCVESKTIRGDLFHYRIAIGEVCM